MKAWFLSHFRSLWTGLLIISLATIAKGIVYLPPFTNGHEIPAVERWIPTTLAAVVWTVAGAMGIASWALKRFGAPMVGICVGLHTLWALLYISGWAAGESPRGYVTAILYVAIVAVVLWAYSGLADNVQKIEGEANES